VQQREAAEQRRRHPDRHRRPCSIAAEHASEAPSARPTGGLPE
jgi:hypothetical protein